MNRFSLLYLYKGSFYHKTYPTRSETDESIKNFSQTLKGIPLGVYDAKTELFTWEASREKEYSQLAIEEQGRRGNEIISIIEKLRASGGEAEPVEEEVETPLVLPEEGLAQKVSSKKKDLTKAASAQ